MRRRTPEIAATLGLGAISGLAASSGSLTLLVVLMGGVALALLGSLDRWVLPTVVLGALVATGSLTVPLGVPTVLQLPGIQVQLYELVLLAGLVTVLIRPAHWRLPWALPGVAFTLLVGLGGLAWWGNGPTDGFRDARYLLEIAAVLVVVTGLGVVARWDYLAWLVAAVLWSSLAVVVVASVGDFALAGRVEGAALLAADQVGAARRFLLPTTPMAVVVLMYLVSLVMQRAVVRAWLLLLGLPAAGLVLVAFSRNHVVGIAVAAVVTLGLGRPSQRVRSAQVALAGFAGLGVIGIVVLAVTTTLSVPFLNGLVAAVQDRFIAGFAPGVAGRDPSLLYRAGETAQALSHAWQSWFTGWGFGYRFRPTLGTPGSFVFDRAPLYAHNFYVWVFLKTGILGVLGVVAALGSATLPGLLKGSRDGYVVAACSAVAGVATIALTNPWPLDPMNSLWFAAALSAPQLAVRRHQGLA